MSLSDTDIMLEIQKAKDYLPPEIREIIEKNTFISVGRIYKSVFHRIFRHNHISELGNMESHACICGKVKIYSIKIDSRINENSYVRKVFLHECAHVECDHIGKTFDDSEDEESYCDFKSMQWLKIGGSQHD